jgi:hypothetical protein
MTDNSALHGNLADALSAFQATLPNVAKGNTASIPGKDGRTGYRYDFANLTDVSAAVLPALAAQGLAWMTMIDTTESGQIVLKWCLMHGASDQRLTGSVPVGRPGEQWQNLGSSITYARRYCLLAVTGVAPGGDDDTDGANVTAGGAPQSQGQPRYEPRQAPRPAPDAPIQQATGDLPADLYDLSGITTVEEARAMYRKAKAAGHIGLLVSVQSPDGTSATQPFGAWLSELANSLTADDAEAAEAAAVAAHEAEMERQQAEHDRQMDAAHE